MTFAAPPAVASMRSPIRIGCAGWSISKAQAAQFAPAGSHLQRYAARFSCVEINSSFYRPHLAQTYARWAQCVPEDFRFAVKLPRAITQYARLVGVGSQLDAFFAQVGALDDKLGCVLIQLPPSLHFERAVATRFLVMLRRRYAGQAVIEPRHATWFDDAADAVLVEHRIGRVAADPAVVELAATPGGALQTVYFRLHGSPRMYYSAYESAYLKALARQLSAARDSGADTWCIFDNTALGAAIPNALQTMRLVR